MISTRVAELLIAIFSVLERESMADTAEEGVIGKVTSGRSVI